MLAKAAGAQVAATLSCDGAPMPSTSSLLAVASLAGLVAAGAASAQPMGWGAMPPPGSYGGGRFDDDREGKVSVATFRADTAGAAALGRGTIAAAAAGGPESPSYEAAVLDQLGKAGYDTRTTAPHSGQIVELTVTHTMIEPEEPPHKPVSGEMSVGVGNRGSAMGMALAVDLSKPANALVSTRLE